MIRLPRLKSKLSSAGDTIPEVMISLAVMGLMIVSAYLLANRSTAISQAAQERVEASKLADGQIELLRNYGDENKLPTSDYFCFQYDDSNGNINLIDIPTDLSSNPDAPYPSGCTAGPDGRFSYAIWSPSRASSINGNGSAYGVTVRWEGGVIANEEVKTFYEIYDSADDAFIAPVAPLTPEPQCNDTYDNEDPEDTATDQDDPACHTDGDISNPASYNPNLNSEIDSQCVDGNNNDVPEDSLIDSADPGCTEPYNQDDTESPNPFDASVSGNGYSSCTIAETNFGDGADGCFIVGSSVRAWREIIVEYPMPDLESSEATLEIKYRQFNNPPPTGYSFNLDFRLGNSYASSVSIKNANLVATTQNVQQTYTTAIIVPTTVPANLYVEWLNNTWSDNDPNLQIDSVRIYRDQ